MKQLTPATLRAFMYLIGLHKVVDKIIFDITAES
jgi:hypothetical protein